VNFAKVELGALHHFALMPYLSKVAVTFVSLHFTLSLSFLVKDSSKCKLCNADKSLFTSLSAHKHLLSPFSRFYLRIVGGFVSL
jgi:hypothetical protein